MEFVGIAILLFGIAWMGGMAFIHLRSVAKAKASETWPATIGRVISSEVVVEQSKDDEGSPCYVPVVAYSYSIAGNALQGSRIRFGNMRRGTRRQAEEIMGRYKAGDPVTVRYNPEKPQESVLETQGPGPLYLILALGGAVAIAVGLFWVAIGTNPLDP